MSGFGLTDFRVIILQELFDITIAKSFPRQFGDEFSLDKLKARLALSSLCPAGWANHAVTELTKQISLVSGWVSGFLLWYNCGISIRRQKCERASFMSVFREKTTFFSFRKRSYKAHLCACEKPIGWKLDLQVMFRLWVSVLCGSHHLLFELWEEHLKELCMRDLRVSHLRCDFEDAHFCFDTSDKHITVLKIFGHSRRSCQE